MSIETKLFNVELLLVIDYLLSDGDENILEELDEFFVIFDGLAFAVSVDKSHHLIEVLHDLF